MVVFGRAQGAPPTHSYAPNAAIFQKLGKTTSPHARRCKHHMLNRCNRSNRCSFAHEDGELLEALREWLRSEDIRPEDVGNGRNGVFCAHIVVSGLVFFFGVS